MLLPASYYALLRGESCRKYCVWPFQLNNTENKCTILDEAEHTTDTERRLPFPTADDDEGEVCPVGVKLGFPVPGESNEL